MKKKLLFYGDAPVGESGFSQVAKKILRALYDTGKYQIDIINRGIKFGAYDTETYPYTIFATNPEDSFGLSALLDATESGKYDILFVINDPSTMTKQNLESIRKAQQTTGMKYILYTLADTDYPLKNLAHVLEVPDKVVAYTKHAKANFEASCKNLKSEIEVIYHGCDEDITPKRKKKTIELRNGILKNAVKDKKSKLNKAFLYTCVNRNQFRKDFPGLMHAWMLFKHKAPHAYLYLHACVNDQGGNLMSQFASLLGWCQWWYPTHGFDWKIDHTNSGIIFAPLKSPDHVFPRDLLCEVYPASDAFVSATIGEGWGLTTTEAMRAALPVILPNNTTAPEIIGDDERGYLVKAGETANDWKISIGNSDMVRPYADILDLANKLEYVYNHREEAKEKGQKAYEWTLEHLWSKKQQQWIDLFDKVLE